ncbi:hypothetical protein ACUXOR_001002 [Staphylococcus pasteuri]
MVILQLDGNIPIEDLIEDLQEDLKKLNEENE